MFVNADNISISVDNNSKIIKNIRPLTSGLELMDSLEYDRNNIKFSNNDVRGSHILITGEKLINKNTKEEYKISVLGDVL